MSLLMENNGSREKVNAKITECLFIASNLARAGHIDALRTLLDDCRERGLFYEHYNWQGDIIREPLEKLIDDLRLNDIDMLSSLMDNFTKRPFDMKPLKAISSPSTPITNALKHASYIPSLISQKYSFPKTHASSSHLTPPNLQNPGLLPWSPTIKNLLDLQSTRYHHIGTITGHFSSTYCVVFDKSDNYIITGGDDALIKIWCAESGLLSHTLRAHSNCISDLSIDCTNEYLSVGSIDGWISIWKTSTWKQILAIDARSPILTLEFQAMDPNLDKTPSDRILMATCSDGYAKFWHMRLDAAFHSAPITFHCRSLARDSIRCASFSPAGCRFVCGASDGIVRLMKTPDMSHFVNNSAGSATRNQSMPSPNSSGNPTTAGEASSAEIAARRLKIPHVQYLEQHTGYINSIHWSNDAKRFLTSSWDGTVREWFFGEKDRKHSNDIGGVISANWSSVEIDVCKIVDSSVEASNPPRASSPSRISGPRKITIVSYCMSDEWAIAAVNETNELFVFKSPLKSNLPQGHVIKYHTDQVYILTSNPVDDRIILSAGCDGRIALWHIGQILEDPLHTPSTPPLFSFHLPNCRFLDGCFSSDGTTFALTDDMGRISVFGMGSVWSQHLPPSQFLASDWHECAFDEQHFAFDLSTQLPFPIENQRLFSIDRLESAFSSQLATAKTNALCVDQRIKAANQALLRSQIHNERELWESELRFPSAGTIPKHSKSRRKRLVYGSDVSEDEQPAEAVSRPHSPNSDQHQSIPLMMGGSETDGAITVTDTEPAYNLRTRTAGGGRRADNSGLARANRRLRLDALARQRNSRRHSQRFRRRWGGLLIDELAEHDEQLALDEEGGSGDAAHNPAAPRRRVRQLLSSDDEEHCPPAVTYSKSWLNQTSPLPWQPQIHDKVAYIPAGHLQLVQFIGESGLGYSAWRPDDDLVEAGVVIGEIVSMKVGKGPSLTLGIEIEASGIDEIEGKLETRQLACFQNNRSGTSHKRVIEIEYANIDGRPDFIIPLCQYLHSLQHTHQLYSSDRVQVNIDGQTYRGQIERLLVSRRNIKSRPWSCYRVNCDGSVDEYSPWELHLEDDGNQHRCRCKLDSEQQKWLYKAAKKIEKRSIYAAFRGAVEKRIFTDYYEIVFYPMHLELLLSRLKSGYYRRIEALLWDIQLIHDNCLLYNNDDDDDDEMIASGSDDEEDGNIRKDAADLVAELRDAVEQSKQLFDSRSEESCFRSYYDALESASDDCGDSGKRPNRSSLERSRTRSSQQAASSSTSIVMRPQRKSARRHTPRILSFPESPLLQSGQLASDFLGDEKKSLLYPSGSGIASSEDCDESHSDQSITTHSHQRTFLDDEIKDEDESPNKRYNLRRRKAVLYNPYGGIDEWNPESPIKKRRKQVQLEYTDTDDEEQDIDDDGESSSLSYRHQSSTREHGSSSTRRYNLRNKT